MKTIGFVINPIAGMGGAVGLKGTDGQYREACARGASPRSPLRAQQALDALVRSNPHGLSFLSCGGQMGSDILFAAGIPHTVVHAASAASSAVDTMAACRAFVERGVDAIVFCGGDGTARDVASVVGDRVPVLGIPSGVKMYSSVFAHTPAAAAAVIASFASGAALVRDASVMDIDEEQYRNGRLDRSLYAQVRSPYLPARVQAPKFPLDQ